MKGLQSLKRKAASSSSAPSKASKPKKEKGEKDSKPSKFSPFDPSIPPGGSDVSTVPLAVHPGRVRHLRAGILGAEAASKKAGSGAEGSPRGPVLLWMSRDQRTRDNWALLYAVQKAQEQGVPVAVVFNLVSSFLGAKARHFCFMLRGLQVVQQNLEGMGIPFFMLQGKAEETVPELAHKLNASLLVTDFSPLRIGRHWREGVVSRLDELYGTGEGGASVQLRGTSVHEVDAHNVVPVWVTSDKLEYAARTIRTRIHRNLPEYLVEFPSMPKEPLVEWGLEKPAPIVWEQLIEDATKAGPEVPEVSWITPGEDAAQEGLLGEKGFLLTRMKGYSDDRNDPSKGPGSVSGMSPWLHYGHVAPQRCALEARKHRSKHPKAVDSFLEEIVVRRELSDNFCYYQPQYDSLDGAWDWARKTLEDHRADKREFVYEREKLELGKTHDDLWNAAQLEMVHYGKMHGYMRMYWAKKILEWTSSPDEALEVAIYLNDKYELDGRDPNGYVGCMWSICGVHDQGWGERAVFGKIRFMNYAGCKRKFGIDGYVRYVKQMVAKVTKEKEKGKGVNEVGRKENGGHASVAEKLMGSRDRGRAK